MIDNGKPVRISSDAWDERIRKIPESFRRECRYLRSIRKGGIPYLLAPSEYARKGDRLLDRLKFDPSPAALRLWAFIFSEKDRLFLVKENGWKIFAVMKDLGQTPVITYSVPKSLSFYADALWWAPCFAENPRLLDEAEKLGATNELCFVRAALGAFKTLDYFPMPDLCFAGVGSCCDDFSAVMQLIEWQGAKVHWWEIPTRPDKTTLNVTGKFARTPFGKTDYPEKAVEFLEKEYKGIVKALEKEAGCRITQPMLKGSLDKFNEIRGLVRNIREMVYGAENVPLPGLETLLVEFIGIHACSEPEEAVNVLECLTEEVERRIRDGVSPLKGKPVRIYWVTPPTDASLITLLEDSGACVAGTDYMISHSYYQLRANIPPLKAIAENYMDDLMIGSLEHRAKKIVEEAARFRADGVLITGIFGASHCPFEEKIIGDMIKRELSIPVMSFDVPYSPGRYSEQVVNRMQSFIEMIKGSSEVRDCESSRVIKRRKFTTKYKLI
ncbi:MAG: 2-hydroxyacyl-CoA dehydratase family protein [Victivallales bacterium]